MCAYKPDGFICTPEERVCAPRSRTYSNRSYVQRAINVYIYGNVFVYDARSFLNG